MCNKPRFCLLISVHLHGPGTDEEKHVVLELSEGFGVDPEFCISAMAEMMPQDLKTPRTLIAIVTHYCGTCGQPGLGTGCLVINLPIDDEGLSDSSRKRLKENPSVLLARALFAEFAEQTGPEPIIVIREISRGRR